MSFFSPQRRRFDPENLSHSKNSGSAVAVFLRFFMSLTLSGDVAVEPSDAAASQTADLDFQEERSLNKTSKTSKTYMSGKESLGPMWSVTCRQRIGTEGCAYVLSTFSEVETGMQYNAYLSMCFCLQSFHYEEEMSWLVE